jgi:hypothetical protein
MQDIKISLLKNKPFLDKLKMCASDDAFLHCIWEIAIIEKIEPATEEWQNHLSQQGKIDVASLDLNKLMNGRNNNCFNYDAIGEIN